MVKINQLIVKTNSKQKTFVRSFVTKPATPVQIKFGKIFGLIEIESNLPKISNLIDVIIDEIKNSYYDSEEINDGINLTDKFEKSLKKTNIAIASFLEAEQVVLDLDKINIIIGLVHGQDLFLAQVGKINCLLLYRLPNKNYRLINIIETTKSSFSVPDPIKLFSQVISGRIRPHDVIFISTNNLLDYFSQDKLINIICSDTLAQTTIQLKTLIEKINSKENFGAMTFEIEKEKIDDIKEVKPQKTELSFTASSPFKESMAGLIRTEKETEKFLTPTLLPEIKKIFINLKDLGGGLFSSVSQSTAELIKNQNSQIKEKILDNHNLSLFNKFTSKTLAFLVPFRAIFNIAFGFLKYKIFYPFVKIGSAIKKTKVGALIERYKAMPKSSQVLFLVSLILAVSFIFSLGFLLRNNKILKATDEFNQIILEVESKKNNAESSLIYRDENLARKLLLEAKTTAANIKPTTSSQKKYLDNLNSEIEEQLKNLRHMVEIAEPVQLANFANLDNQVQLANFAALYKRLIFTQNLNNKNIFKVNLDTWVMNAIAMDNQNLGNIKFGLTSENEIVLINEEKKLFRLRTDNDSISSANFDIPQNGGIADVGAFKNYLYVLDNANNQVYRLTKNANGFEGKTDWIKAVGLDLKDASAIAIDGSVYILKNNGEIVKLSNGKPDTFEVNSVEPQLNMPTKIKTTDVSKYLYVLDPNNKRIVVINKETGNLVIQYTSPAFDDLKDISIDEADKKIFVLNKTTVLGIPTEHIK